ncbi:MAG: RNA-binding S4 domain-containing protein [Neisseria sp.]|nr:RNA-binding S4 domain-containing protein [Neisseria sp.]
MKPISFNLCDAPYIPLCDLLKTVGVTDSGGQAKMLIAAGEVRRNGEVETRKTAKIRSGEIITLGEATIQVLP